jgi:hypothetical protein
MTLLHIHYDAVYCNMRGHLPLFVKYLNANTWFTRPVSRKTLLMIYTAAGGEDDKK